MGALANAVAKLSRPTNVTIRTELVYDDDGRDDGSQSETTYSIRLSMQPQTGRTTTLLRTDAGDETTGRWRVHVTDDALSAVGLATLPIAPPEDTDGPPGALIDWKGRRYEVTELGDWNEQGFSGPSQFRRFIAAERGAAP